MNLDKFFLYIDVKIKDDSFYLGLVSYFFSFETKTFSKMLYSNQRFRISKKFVNFQVHAKKQGRSILFGSSIIGFAILRLKFFLECYILVSLKLFSPKLVSKNLEIYIHKFLVQKVIFYHVIFYHMCSSEFKVP